MLGAAASFHYHAVCFLAALARSKAEFTVVKNTDCAHIREDGGSWIHDPHWFGPVSAGHSTGGGCQGGMMYMCEPKWSAEAHPEDLGIGWSIPMFLQKEAYESGESVAFECNDQIATTRNGLNGGVLSKFMGSVTWTCKDNRWEPSGVCRRARYCRARSGEIKLSPSSLLEHTSLALIHVTLDVHEMERYEVSSFACTECSAHDVKSQEAVTSCKGKVLLRCNENDEVTEVDNTCVPAKKTKSKKKTKKKNKKVESTIDESSSLLEMDDDHESPRSVLERSKSFLHSLPTKRKAHSEHAAHRRPSHGREHNLKKRRHEA